MLKPKNGSLIVAALAAILASTCCLGPLILMLFGISGAWIGNLTRLEPYRPIFLVVGLIPLFFAWKRAFHPKNTCEVGKPCSTPEGQKAYKIIFWIIIVLYLIALGFPYVLPLFY